MGDNLQQRTRLTRRGMHEMRLFFTALQFFTRAPIPKWVGFEPEWLGQSSRYFPAVGIVVGAVSAIVYLLCDWIFPQLVAVLLSTLAAIVFTGALHEDGLTDAADGFGGAATADQTLEIMADSRVGAVGVLAIGLVLALKCAALSYLEPSAVVGGLLVAHPLSRLAATMLMWRLDYAKAAGKARPMTQRLSARDFYIAAIPVVMIAVVVGALDLLSWEGIAFGILVAIGIAARLGQIVVRRLGGYTGDCLGAVQQLAEAGCYLAFLAVV